MASDERLPSLDELDCALVVHVLSFLQPHEVARASLACKLIHGASQASVLWRALYDRCVGERVRQHLMPPPAQIRDWRGAVIRGLMLGALQYGAWERITPETERCGRPTPREGHAAASWGADSMILFGGWGSGIRNDLFILDRVPAPTRPSPNAEATGSRGVDSEAGSGAGPSTSAAAAPAGAAAAAGAAAPAAPWLAPGEHECGWRWRVPRVAGRRPAIRYGHTVTRCGPQGEMLAVFGGMQAGGYSAEITALSILRPYSGSDMAQDGEPPYEYEWYHPDLTGCDPGARGYHSAAASEDGCKLYLFGGIARRDSCNLLTAIDLTTFHVERPAATGQGPCARFGCSLRAFKGRLWVVGGGNGSDLARSGRDMTDVFSLNLATLEWSRVETANKPHSNKVMGRCHASCLVGSKLLMFGGSLDLGNDVTWLDLGPPGGGPPVWGRPTVLGVPPGKRMSAVVALSGGDMLCFGGWIYSQGEMGDLSRLRLLLKPGELAPARRREEGAAAAEAARADEGAGTSAGGAARSGGLSARSHLRELLSSKVSRYYQLMRSAQDLDTEGLPVPRALMREMHETMIAIRVLRAHADDTDEEEEEEDGDGEGGGGGWGPEELAAVLAHVGAEEEEEEEEGEEGEGVERMAGVEYDLEETGEEETEGSEEDGDSDDDEEMEL